MTGTDDQRSFDDRETRDPDAREADLMARLPELIGHAVANAPGTAQRFPGIEAAAITSRDALATLPVLRKSELKDLQAGEHGPLAGFNATPLRDLATLFRSPGPINECDGRDTANWWRYARALFASGFRSGDVLHNCFSYHFTPAGRMIETAADALGCVVFPGGTGNTEGQVEAIEVFRADGYVGVPDFLRIIVEKADELGRDVSSLKKAHVSGGPLFPAVREKLQARGITVRQSYATADLGLVAYETEAMDGMVIDEDVLVEIVRPGTNDPVPDGEVGEVVVTTFNRDYPLIRFGTGDLSAILAGQSACGRTNRRIKGWMGRADQTTKVKGMFVHPEQVAKVVARHPEIAKARLVVARAGDNDVMTLRIEAAPGTVSIDAISTDAVAASLQSICNLKGGVETVAPGGLPNDGKVIDDTRDFGG